MKKKLIGLMLLLAAQQSFNSTVHLHKTTGPTPVTYKSAQGPLQLEDKVNSPGVITQTLSNPVLQKQAADIARFAATVPNITTYQDILFAAEHAIGQPLAIDAIKAFEDVIIYLYNKEAYLIMASNPNPHRKTFKGIFFKGIRHSWINPSEWINPKSWTSDNNKKLDQLIDEIAQLSTIAMKHSTKLGLRMKITVQSHRNWRTAIILPVAAYVIVDAYKRGNQSVIATLATNAGNDCSKVIEASKKTASALASSTTNKAAELGSQLSTAVSTRSSAALESASNNIGNAWTSASDTVATQAGKLRFW